MDAKPKADSKKLKTRKCKVCRATYTPVRPLQSACGTVCALALAQARRERDTARVAREDRKRTRAQREAMKTISQLEKAAQTEVNRYVRLRDHHLGCCSCDKPASWGGQWHASHLRSVGAASSIRFHLWNIAKACSQCNNHLSGNLSEYLPRAIARMGQERVDWLYAQNKTVKRTREYLERLRSVFKAKANRLQKRLQ